MRLVQLHDAEGHRRIALVDEPNLRLIEHYSSIYDLFIDALEEQSHFSDKVQMYVTDEEMDYEAIYSGNDQWRLLPAFDQPYDPLHCMLTGTGLTHKASAENRQKMNTLEQEGNLTDSMKMYLMGADGGHPEDGKVGVQPEWFYKGNGLMLRGHNDFLDVPAYANNGGEEPEIAGVYLNDSQGKPWRVGFVTGNEFSDHVMEKVNYLYLAPSKIRTCSIGPELVLDHDFQDISGTVKVSRKGSELWSKEVRTGEVNMAHSLANLEHHHFKYANHQVPGQVHIHFFGTGAFSFGDQVFLRDGDEMEVYWEGMGRALRNTLREVEGEEYLVITSNLG